MSLYSVTVKPDTRSLFPVAGLIGLTLLIGAIGPIAEAGVSGVARTTAHSVERGLGTLRADAEHAVYIGGILIEWHRHAIAGSTMGCALGAGIGATAAAGAGLLTGGAGFAALPYASAAGCSLGGMAGAALGSPHDDQGLDL
jgi:hypothetical protein